MQSCLHPLQGLKLDEEAGAEWQEVLATAQAMVKQHQGSLSHELAPQQSAGPSEQAEEQPISPSSLLENPSEAPVQAADQDDGAVAAVQGAPDPAGPLVKQELADAAVQKPEAVWLSDMLAGCVSMLLTMHRFAEQPVGGQSLDVALANSLRLLQPHAVSNQPVYRKIEQMVSLLRNRLLQA